ncbi:MAG: glycine dehydrogenase subunit 2 [Dehalococcoidia bacterium]|nr:glycine dehydrogenase subunit 2 [Dehalococcoidia bacterium]
MTAQTTIAGALDRRLLMDRSVPGRVALTLPASDVPLQAAPSADLLRKGLDLPEISQLDMVRYFTNLSQLNFSIDTNFYPLGSCTMKYNPKINDEVASLPGFRDIHPNQPDEQVQGALRVMFELQHALGEITGLPGVSLAPLAGAQGEYAGLLIARAYHESRGDSARTVAIIPDSAHGTNPASAAMAGLEVVTVPSNAQGGVDVDALRKLADNRTAVFMLTLPSTLGLFEMNILEITKIIHDAGGLVYADGANLNALLGIVKIGELGFDICHSNLHKTFSTPHGGGGPGAGPVMVAARLAEFLPEPVVVREPAAAKSSLPATSHHGDAEPVEAHHGAKPDAFAYRLSRPPKSTGKISGFHGSFSILVRAYTYIRSMGRDGLRSAAENAIINANYIQAGLKDKYALAVDRYCMHETVLSAKRQHARGAAALDVAKRLLDYGIHAPTMYFPMIVEQALMVEPTESESKETLDNFIQVMRQIDDEIDRDPALLHDAPHDLPVSRMDEATAARKPYLRWQKSG